jgi:hypothetical protein
MLESGPVTPAPRVPDGETSTLRVPINHPCWSSSMSVLVQDTAAPVISANVEADDQSLHLGG